MRRLARRLGAATRPSRVATVELCRTWGGTDHSICLAVRLGRLGDE